MAYTIKPLAWDEISKNRYAAKGITGNYHIAPNPEGGFTWWLATRKCETGFDTVTAAKLSASVHHANSLVPYLQVC